MVRFVPHLAVAVLLASIGGSAFAGDGVLEINQACAVESGCFFGDEPGFPVTIDGAAGRSYRLTGDLNPPDIETTAILIDANGVTLDMSGFGIIFPGNGCLNQSTCPQGAGDGIGSGSGRGRRVAIRNGLIANAGRDGIVLSDIALVEAVRVTGCGRDGIVLNPRSILTRSHVDSCGANGVRLGGNTVFSHSVFGINNRLGGQAADRTGGIPTIGNMCADGSCGPTPRKKRYYLADVAVNGSQAADPGVCRPGFHFASFGELVNPSSLEYDSNLGITRDDSGGGPPVAGGWLRGGFGSRADNNCSNWTSADVAQVGFVMFIDRPHELQQAAQKGSPWNTDFSPCSSPQALWCIED